MTALMGLHIDASELSRAPPALSRAYIAAGRRAVKRTASWARTQATRAIANADNLPQKALRDRRRVTVRAGGGMPGVSQTLWMGFLPIAAVYLGKPRQTHTGVTVRGRQFAHAFLATMKSGHTGIFLRAGRARLPINEVTVPLEKAEGAIAGLQAQIPARLQKEMASELNYQLNVKGLK